MASQIENRQRKAWRLIAQLDRETRSELKREPTDPVVAAHMVEVLRSLPQAQWDELAKRAGTNPPNTSREVVVLEFQRRAERQWRTA